MCADFGGLNKGGGGIIDYFSHALICSDGTSWCTCQPTFLDLPNSLVIIEPLPYSRLVYVSIGHPVHP
jgi:uncharacterized protein YceK